MYCLKKTSFKGRDVKDHVPKRLSLYKHSHLSKSKSAELNFDIPTPETKYESEILLRKDGIIAFKQDWRTKKPGKTLRNRGSLVNGNGDKRKKSIQRYQTPHPKNSLSCLKSMSTSEESLKAPVNNC